MEAVLNESNVFFLTLRIVNLFSNQTNRAFQHVEVLIMMTYSIQDVVVWEQTMSKKRAVFIDKIRHF